MWLFTRYGFFSVACAHRADGTLDPLTVMIRARRVAHLRMLQKRFPALASQEVRTKPDADYRHRIVISKVLWAEIVAELVQEQEWSNFKNEVARYQGTAGSDYSGALHRVWNIMFDLQGREGD
jgi:hypothetical protein